MDFFRYLTKTSWLVRVVPGLFIALVAILGLCDRAYAGTITVSSAADTNTSDTILTLREAILISNGALGRALSASETALVSGTVGAGQADTINFNISLADKIIDVLSTPLPSISDGSTTIDGYTQAGTSVNTNATGALNMTLVIELNGTSASTGSLITFASSDNLVRGLNLRLARISGITSTAGANNNKVQGNIIGLIVAGTTASANVSGGIVVVGGTGWVIGTDGDGVNDAAERNVVSGNTQSGISLTSNSDSNVIAGNIIGLDKAGTTDRGNSLRGIRVDGGSDSNRIGTNGDNVSDNVEQNVVSGNTSNGIYISASDNNWVAGNILGLNASGTSVTGITSPGSGVNINTGADNTIVGTDGSADAFNANERNIISGNTDGVSLGTSNPTNNVVAGNYIGLDVTGTIDLGNSNLGVASSGGVLSLRVGTNGDGVADLQERNVISGNNGGGISLPTGSNNAVVAGNYIGLNAAGTAAVGNGNRAVNVFFSTSGVRVGTNGDGVSDDLERNVISGNASDGIAFGDNSDNNIAAGNYIGTSADGTVSIPNTGGAVVIYTNSDSNRVGTDGNGSNDEAERNILSSSGTNGILIVTTSNNNIVAGNYIGTDVTGTVAFPNLGSGIAHGGSTGTRIGTNGDGVSDILEGNLVSGNSTKGIGVDTSANTIIAGNIIGLNAAGTAAIPNIFDGVVIESSSTGFRVGTNGDGVSDTLERNIISGNGTVGLKLANGADSGVVAGNYIGTDTTGTVDLGNGAAGLQIENADSNRVGTNGDGVSDVFERNIISGNNGGVDAHPGLYIVVGSDNNTVAGNYIGLNAAGTADLGNTGDGILIDGSTLNIIGVNGDASAGEANERNVISGNDRLGILVHMADSNTIAGNYIGLNAAGTAAIGNSNSGIQNTNGSDFTVIGTDGDGTADAIEGNVVSGNGSRGIDVIRSNSTVIAGNIVGLNGSGTTAIPNASAGVLITAESVSAGAVNNNRIGTNGDGVSDSLERNIISGNNVGGVGIEISDWNSTAVSTGNVVAGNYIGTDITGLLPIMNYYGGVEIYSFVQGTIVGFDGVGDPAVERNVLSGNGTGGFYSGHWDTTFFQNTVIASNYIGVGSDGLTAVPNGQRGVPGNGVGVWISDDSAGNVIGGDTLAEGNLIAYNTDGGIVVLAGDTYTNTLQNEISHNRIFDNTGLAIDLSIDQAMYVGDGVTFNDTGDTDAGSNPNLGMNYPVITSVSADGVNITVNGTLDTSSAMGASIEVYLANGSVHTSNHGDLITFLGLASPINNSPGNWSLVVANSELTPRITAVAIDSAGNTSEASCTWPPTTPETITTLSGYAGNNKATLTWTLATDCAAITDYIVEYDDGGGYQVFADGVSATTGAVVTGLANGTAYSFHVAAVGPAGTGLYSNVVIITPIGIPDPIDDLAASSSDTQIILTWTDPGGSTVDDYLVQYGVTSGFPGNAATFVEGTGLMTTAIVTGLTNETSYSFRVYAVNGVGSSPSSNVVASTPNTAAWVLNTTDTLDTNQDAIAITNASGHIEIYGSSSGGQDSNQRAIYDPLAAPGARWTNSTVFANRFGSGKAFFSGGLNYVFGQNNTSYATAQIYSVVPEGGAITPLTAFSTVPYHSESRFARVGGYVYALGGYEWTVQNFSDVYRYELATDTWITAGFAPVPGPARRQGFAEGLNNLVYFGGGDTSPGTGGGTGGTATVTGRMDVYDPVANTWDTTKAPMPVGRAEPCTVVHDGLLYVVSGRGVTSVRQEVLRYDPSFNQWSKAASVTKQRKYCSAAVSYDQLYAFFGGVQQTGASVQHNDFETMSVANAAPTTPTHLYVDETDAQTGGSNPTALASGTPVFSAICNDPNWSDIVDQYRIQVDDTSDFSSPVWDSGPSAMTECRQGTRSANITYGAAALTLDGSTYFWRIKFWDDAAAEGSFSETTGTNQFTLTNPNFAPTAPTVLFAANANAQGGSTNPIDITNETPVFSAICNDPDAGDTLNKYQIQVDDTSDFSSVVWDSGATGSSMLDCTAGDRSQNITFGGVPLERNGAMYYWRIKFWDAAGLAGVFSEDPLSTNTFTMAQMGGASVQRLEQMEQQNQELQEEPVLEQPTAPSLAPTAGSVTVVGSSSIRYEWSYGDTANILGFHLKNAQNETLVEVASPTAVAATEIGLPHNTLVSGRKVTAYNEAGESDPSDVYPDTYTWMIPVTPKLVSRQGSKITVSINEVLNNLQDGQSGVRFELISIAQTAAASVDQGSWNKDTTYVFDGVNPDASYLVRVRARNFNAVTTDWSSTLSVGIAETVPTKPELAVSLIITSADGRSLTSALNPNSILNGEIRVVNNGDGRATNVLLTMPIPTYINYIPGTLSIDGRHQTDGADGDMGQSGNSTLSAIWSSLDFGFGHTVRFQFGFDTQRLTDDFVQAVAAANPVIVLQAQVSAAEVAEPVYSDSQSLVPDIAVLQPLAPPVPPTPPTIEQVQIIQQILQQQFPQEGEPESQPTIPLGETQSSFSGGNFELSAGSGDDRLSMSGHATAANDLIRFTGTTSQPFAVITLIFNGSITVIATADMNGNWQTFVSAEQLGIREGEQQHVLIEAIAANGGLQSERVQIGDVLLSRGQQGQTVVDFQTIVSQQGLVRAVTQAKQAVVNNEPAIQTTLTVAAPVLIVSSAPLWGYLPYAPTLVYHFISWLLGLVGRKRKDEDHPTYGVVYDAITKSPLALAIVRIYNNADNKLASTIVTDKLGRYDALLAPGQYRLEVSKPQYQYPSGIVTSTVDGSFDRIYNKQAGFTVTEQSTVLPHVPVDPINAKRQWDLSFGFKKLWLAFQRAGNLLATPIIVVGMLMSLALLYAVPGKPSNWIIAGLYALTLAIQFKLKPKLIKAWGVVYDVASNAILPLVTIQLIEPATSKVVTSRLSDYEGRFTFLPEPGSYVVKASKPGFTQVTEVVQSPFTDRQPLPQTIDIKKPSERVSGDVAMKQG